MDTADWRFLLRMQIGWTAESLLRAIRNGQRWLEILINGDFTVSRKGDCGKLLAAGEILSPFLHLRTACRGGCREVGQVAKFSTKALVKPFCKRLART